MTSLEREDTRLGNTGPNAVRTVFEKIVFIVPTLRWCSFDFFFFFSRVSKDGMRDAQRARFEYLFRTRGNEKSIIFC